MTRRRRSPDENCAITICGSLRKDSINEVLRRHMSQKLREAGVEVTDLDLNDFEMPIFNQDIEDAGQDARGGQAARRHVPQPRHRPHHLARI